MKVKSTVTGEYFKRGIFISTLTRSKYKYVFKIQTRQLYEFNKSMAEANNPGPAY